jgi:uncharacterized protein (DUF1810 family)
MNDEFELQKFLEAEEDHFKIALKEILIGNKLSQWIWYIFPQYKGLGRSETSKKYSIKSKEEAIKYFEHEILGKRLLEITQAFLNIDGKSAYNVLGSPNNFKLKSCITLFHIVQDETDIIKKVLDKFYDGKLSHRTKELLSN